MQIIWIKGISFHQKNPRASAPFICDNLREIKQRDKRKEDSKRKTFTNTEG